MKLPTVILMIIAIYFLGFFSHALYLQKTVYGDGRYYYTWLHSLVFDQDIDFRNEYKHFKINEPQTPQGLPQNKYSIGSALLWMPTYISARTVLRGDGWSEPYQFVVGLTSVLMAITGLTLLIRLLKQPASVTGLVLLLIAGATNLLFYGSIDAVNSHALSFFVAILYMSFVATNKKQWAIIGFTLALLASIRLQDIVFILLLIPSVKRIQLKPFICGFVIGFLPQLIAWYGLNGSLANPYLTGGERFDLLHPHILEVLFSPLNGLVLWTPIVAVGIYGLLMKWRAHWPYLAVFLAELMIVSCWEVWWQGASVSGRMFVSSLPLVAIGLGTVMQRLYQTKLYRSTLPLLAVSLTLLNSMIIYYYLVIH